MRTYLAMAILLVALQPAFAEIAGLRVWVGAQDGAEFDAAALADAGVEAVALPAELADGQTVAAMHAAGLQVLGTMALGDALTPRTEWPADLDGLLVTSLPDGEIEGRPAWEVEHDAAEGSLEHLLAVKRSGDAPLAFLRDLTAATDLPIYLAMLRDDAFPETARWRYAGRHTLLSEGAIDGVLLAGDALDLRRPRLSTPEPIIAGIACPDAPTAAAMTLLRSRDADVLLVPATTDPVAWLEALQATLAGLERAEQDRREFAEAVERGDLAIVAGAEAVGDLDVATIHGVAQSFALAEAAEVVGVGLHCILRGPNALGQPDLRLTIRPDAGGAPDMETVLAEGAIPAAAFAEPGFQWGYARLDPPVALDAGTAYWLHAEDTTGGGNSFVCHITKAGDAYPGGNAWSRSYDYVTYDWIFRVLAEGGEAP